MIKIKLTIPYPELSLEKQTPNSTGMWEDYQFFINQKIDEYDYFVVCGMLKTYEKITCSKENSIFVMTEPSSMERYNDKFLNQFGTIVTSQQQINHPNKILMQILPWSIGTKHTKGQKHKVVLDYDYLKKEKPKKTKIISIISSNKTFTKGHKKRIKFINKLKKHFGDKLDIFGAGINPIPKKWDGIAPYKYHIAIENSSHKYYWTEKLADAFLGEAYPIYYGCSNIYDYFSKNSLTVIDINKPKKAIKIIENTIENNLYENSITEIAKAKELILDKYNLFPMICNIIENKIKHKKHSGLKKNDIHKIIEFKPISFYSKKPSLIKQILNKFKQKSKFICKKMTNLKNEK